MWLWLDGCTLSVTLLTTLVFVLPLWLLCKQCLHCLRLHVEHSMILDAPLSEFSLFCDSYPATLGPAVFPDPQTQ